MGRKINTSLLQTEDRELANRDRLKSPPKDPQEVYGGTPRGMSRGHLHIRARFGQLLSIAQSDKKPGR
jgi:hypothetical protein